MKLLLLLKESEMKDIIKGVIKATESTGKFIQREAESFDRTTVEEKKGFATLSHM